MTLSDPATTIRIETPSHAHAPAAPRADAAWSLAAVLVLAAAGLLLLRRPKPNRSLN